MWNTKNALKAGEVEEEESVVWLDKVKSGTKDFIKHISKLVLSFYLICDTQMQNREIQILKKQINKNQLINII